MVLILKSGVRVIKLSVKVFDMFKIINWIRKTITLRVKCIKYEDILMVIIIIIIIIIIVIINNNNKN